MGFVGGIVFLTTLLSYQILKILKKDVWVRENLTNRLVYYFFVLTGFIAGASFFNQELTLVIPLFLTGVVVMSSESGLLYQGKE